jgi:hypothetical protein
LNESPHNWVEANQHCLVAAVATVRATLERHAARATAETSPDQSLQTTSDNVQQASAALPVPPAMETLCAAFALSPFERDVLLMCAGMELDGAFAASCAAAQNDPHPAYPTFSLALAALPDAHWNALTPTAPLRRWRLIEIANIGESLLHGQLRIDERVLHYLAGISYLDQRLEGLVKPFTARRELPLSQQHAADRIADLWSRRKGSDEWPIVALCGRDQSGKRSVAAQACSMLGLSLRIMRAADVPQSAAEREAFARLWEREAILLNSALLLEQGEQDLQPAALSLIEALNCLLFVSVPESLSLRDRLVYRVDVRKPSSAEQESLWIDALGPTASQMNGALERVVSQFSLGTDAIYNASELARENAAPYGDETVAGSALWDACRAQARPRLDDLAQRIIPAATWNELVLPELQMRDLHQISAHIRRRAKVYGEWGFATKGERGLGISALFAGASGTGKTMAAEVLANELQLDLYRIDLSQVVSKYIGETEKNLRRVFDAAEEGGAILLFDEADALFGKRSEVKDSHDRYANIEVSYLLQRMETYRGLAILTTNLKTAVDTAFLRRLRFIIQFPFPDAAHRAQIWRNIFPVETPVEAIDFTRLARLSIPGGNIRNIALHAAFHAAEAGDVVTMAHLARAARGEYTKLEKPLTEAEIGGWV